MVAAAVVPIRVKSPNAPIDGIEAPYGTRKITVCSVFFQPCERYPMNIAAIRPDGSYGGFSVYEMPAAPRDGFVALDVYSGYSWVSRWVDTSDDGRPELTPMPVSPESIVDDLIHRWAKSTIGADDQVGPGIGVIQDSVPTDAELRQLRTRQETWCQVLVDTASGYHITGKHREITELHRNSARWLLSDAADQLPWMNKKVYLSVKDCPACGEQIMASAIQCRHCTASLPKFYRDYKLDVAERDPAVHAFMQDVKRAEEAQRAAIAEANAANRK